MYYDLVVADSDMFRLIFHGDAAFYPASTPMKERPEPGLRFMLAAGRPWQWTGDGGSTEVTLTDILAAVNYARIAKLPDYGLIDPAAIHAAHARAMQAALAAGDTSLTARLMREQSEVGAPALIGEEDAAQRLGILGRSLDIMKLQYRSICPPVLIAGKRRTKWFWAERQFEAWREDRPGKGWRGRQGRDGGPAAPASPGPSAVTALPSASKVARACS
jgi:hypothetical protein